MIPLATLSTAFGPNGIAVAGGVTYVAEGDPSGAELQVFGAAPSAWTSYGPAAFQNLAGVGCNSAGTTIYVLDAGDGTADGTAAVYAFTSAGATITSWNGYGTTDFREPDGLAVDAQGNVYVADFGNWLVEEFTPTGSVTTIWSAYNSTPFAGPEALAFDGSGNLYVGDFGPSTSSVEVVYEFSGGPNTGVNQWAMIANCEMSGIGVDGSGNVYVADYANGFVEEFAPNSGGLTTDWDSGTNFGPACVLPTGGNLLVGDWNNDKLDTFN
jgi:sugar lactone lactonase YvrE